MCWDFWKVYNARENEFEVLTWSWREADSSAGRVKTTMKEEKKKRKSLEIRVAYDYIVSMRNCDPN